MKGGVNFLAVYTEKPSAYPQGIEAPGVLKYIEFAVMKEAYH